MKASLFALVVLGACTGGSSQQVITGQVATDFPAPVTAVRVIHQGSVVTSAPVAADGTFRLAFAPSNNLAIQLVSGAKSKLVFPRHVGGNQTLFAVRSGGGAFDLGKIHFVADAGSTPIAFHDDGTEATECEDGHDATGAVCADDSDSSGGTCGADNESEQEGSGSDDVDDGLADDGDAVPEHNFPADGCSDDGNDGSDGSDSGSDGSGGSGGSGGSDDSGSGSGA